MHRPRAALGALAALLVLLMTVHSAQASIVLTFDTSINGNAPNKVDASKSFLAMTFEDTTTDVVKVTLDATNLVADNFVPFALFNYSGNNANALLLGTVGGSRSSQYAFTTVASAQILVGGNQVKAGLFNIAVGFNTDGNTDRFSGGEIAFFSLTATGLRASDFLLTSIDRPDPDGSTGGWYAAAEVRGIQLGGGLEGIGFIGANTAVVPEPSSLALTGLGILALAATNRRRRKEA